RRLAEERRLTDTWAAHHQDAATRLDDVADDRDRAEDGATDAARDADHPPLAIADGRDAMQGALDAGAAVVAEVAEPLHDGVGVLFGYGMRREQHLAARKAGLWLTPEVHDHLEQVASVRQPLQRIADVRGQDVEQLIQVVGDALVRDQRSRGLARA